MINKNSKIDFYYIIFTFSMAINFSIKNNRKLLLKLENKSINRSNILYRNIFLGIFSIIV